MVGFYEQMLRKGLAPSAGLRAAKLDGLRSGAPPRLWAAFVFWGLPD